MFCVIKEQLLLYILIKEIIRAAGATTETYAALWGAYNDISALQVISSSAVSGVLGGIEVIVKEEIEFEALVAKIYLGAPKNLFQVKFEQ